MAESPVLVLILRDVGEVREVAERTHDGDRRLEVERVESRCELRARLRVAVAAEADRETAHVLDDLIEVVALGVAHRLAEQAPEQADVLPDRRVVAPALLRALHDPQVTGCPVDSTTDVHRSPLASTCFR